MLVFGLCKEVGVPWREPTRPQATPGKWNPQPSCRETTGYSQSFYFQISASTVAVPQQEDTLLQAKMMELQNGETTLLSPGAATKHNHNRCTK